MDVGNTTDWQQFLALKPLGRIAPTYTARSRDVYLLDGQYTRTLIVAEPPPALGPLWLTPLLEQGGDVTVSVHVTPLTTGETTRLLRLRRVQHLSDMQQRAKQGRLSDPTEEQALASASTVEAQVVAGTTRLFHTAITLVLRAPSMRALHALETRISDYLARQGATVWPATYEHAAGFHDGTPLARRLVGRERTLDTTSLAYSFLYNASNVGMPAGPVWGVSQHDRRPVRYDPWNRALGVEAPHVAIIAPTGTGKTVLAATLLCEALCGGADQPPAQVVIADPKADYGRLVAYFGGTTLRWSVRDTAQTINVMQITPGQTFDEAVQTVLGLVALATSTPHFPMAPATTGIWEAAIRAAYARYGIDPHQPETWQAILATGVAIPRTPADYPTLATLEDVVGPGHEWDTPTLAQALYPWAVGTYAGLFARPTTVDLDAPLLSFDLESLTHNEDAGGRLRAVASYLIGAWTWALARSAPARRLLVLDEVATLLAYPETALLVGNWLALGRSYGLQVLHMSQQYLDYTGTEQGRRAISNTPTLALLKQVGGDNLDQLAADFRLTEAQQHFLLRAKRGVPGQWGTEALLVTPRGTEQIEILPAPEVLNVLATGTLGGNAVTRALEEAEAIVEAA